VERNHEKLISMASLSADHDDLVVPAEDLDRVVRTHPRVQVILLSVCALAAVALVAATHLPWFGPFANGGSEPQYSAVSGVLVPPGSPSGLVPDTQSWGFLITAFSVFLAASAVVAAVTCASSRQFRSARRMRYLLVAEGIMSVIMVALVALEFMPRVPFDGPATLGFDWGTMVGLGCAVTSSFAAWFAWATASYPHLWGNSSSYLSRVEGRR
jgi:hypothetical protein